MRSRRVIRTLNDELAEATVDAAKATELVEEARRQNTRARIDQPGCRGKRGEWGFSLRNAWAGVRLVSAGHGRGPRVTVTGSGLAGPAVPPALTAFAMDRLRTAQAAVVGGRRQTRGSKPETRTRTRDGAVGAGLGAPGRLPERARAGLEAGRAGLGLL